MTGIAYQEERVASFSMLVSASRKATGIDGITFTTLSLTWVVYIAVPPLLCGHWPRRVEICGGSTDAVPGQVVDMPVIVLTVQFLVDVVGKRWSRTVEQTPASVLQGRVCNAQWSMSLRNRHVSFL